MIITIRSFVTSQIFHAYSLSGYLFLHGDYACLFVCFLSGHFPSDGKWGFIKGFYLTSKGAVRTTVWPPSTRQLQIQTEPGIRKGSNSLSSILTPSNNCTTGTQQNFREGFIWLHRAICTIRRFQNWSWALCGRQNGTSSSMGKLLFSSHP